MQVKAEDLAYWYLRLNGCLTTRNFVIHPEWRREGTGTEADILGVRFPHRCELMRRPLKDDHWFCEHDGQLLLAIVEVKKGLCDLNGPWVKSDRNNVQKVLRAVGAFKLEKVSEVATDLYKYGVHSTGKMIATLMMIGKRENTRLRQRYPEFPQIVWPRILDFIYHRFHGYKDEKAWHQPWDKVGQGLYDTAIRRSNKAEFHAAVEVID